MTLSRTEIHTLVGELTTLLSQGRVRGIQGDDSTFLVLSIIKNGGVHHLFFSVQPGLTRLHLVSTLEKRKKGSGFCQLLRKVINGAVLEKIKQLNSDRAVRLEFNIEGVEQGQSWALVAELTGRHANIFLLDEHDEIVASLGRNTSYKRELIPGNPYIEPIPIPISPREGNRFAENADGQGGANRAAAAFYEKAEAEARRQAINNELRKVLRRSVRKIEKRILRIEGDLAKAKQADDFHRFGELLKQRASRLGRGLDELAVVDYFDPQLPQIMIPLDPRLTIPENMARYFKLYRKFRCARVSIKSRLDSALGELASLQTLDGEREEADNAASLPELHLLRDELIKRKLMPPLISSKGASRRKMQAKALPYREYLSLQGDRILVGRSARTNDILTFRVARGNDIWLHAKDFAGSHVVILKSEPHPETLRDAAALALHWSKGRDEPSADVLYTKRKYVTRAKGLPAGKVYVAEGKTLQVKQAAGRLERLQRKKRENS